MNVLPFPVRVRVACCLAEGNSLRATARLVGVQPNTVMRFALQLGRACDRFHRARVRGLCCSTLELDEIWAFVSKKQKRVRPDDPPELGDAYTFVGLCADAKLIVSYLTGKRTGDAARAFCRDLRARVVGKPQITTDGFDAYRDAIDAAFGADVHYAVLVKEFEGDSTRQDAAHRYSPGRVIGSTTRVVSGRPDVDRISTSYVERSNLETRTNVRRFTRLTNAFSKRLAGLRAAFALHASVHNWVRVHQTLRTTPAAEVGLARGPWSMAELLEAALAEPEVEEPEPDPGLRATGGETAQAVRAVGAFRVIDGGRR